MIDSLKAEVKGANWEFVAALGEDTEQVAGPQASENVNPEHDKQVKERDLSSCTNRSRSWIVRKRTVLPRKMRKKSPMRQRLNTRYSLQLPPVKSTPASC